MNPSRLCRAPKHSPRRHFCRQPAALLSLILCCALLVQLTPSTSAGSPVPAQVKGASRNSQARRVKPDPPQPGAPIASLPNLDDVRHHPPQAPQAPAPVTSTVRSHHKPLEPRRGRKVGDPLPPASGVARYGTGGATQADSGSSGGSAWGGYSYGLARFLVSPSYEQLRPFAVPTSFFGPAPVDGLDASFDLFEPTMPQAGGAKVVFASNRDGQAQIYVMNSDGTGQIRLIASGGNDDYPRWSPNGSKILFQSDRDNPSTGYNDIYVMNSDGTGQTRLTTDPNDDSSASWSPDGSRVVFQSIRNGQFYQVYVMNSDGTGQLNLSNSTGSDGQPTWSSDGSKIAFASERDHEGFASIYVMNSDGTNQRRLTFSADDVTDEQPVWSRDGSKVAFVSTRDGNKEVYVMNADGTNQMRLTNDAGNDDSPYWSPDGSKIIFRSDRERDCCDPTSQVWVMNADGTGQANLSGNQFGDYTSSWAAGGSGNQPPVANAGGSYSGITGQNTVFNGSSSFDPDGSIASYSWSFGDGGAAPGVSPTHIYAAPGTYTVTLTVTDNLGAQGSAAATVNVSSSSSDQFVSNFLQWGLARQPTGQEGSYWDDILRAAYPQGQTSMLLAMREFGMTVFESAEYAARNRTDHWYVYDLYKTYLMRDPDPQGWAWWEAQVPGMGREQVRHAFDQSDEFHQIVATLTASGAPSPTASSLASARVDPFNQTGDQIRARDCEWGITLLSLPGRAGLDLGLGLSYSSLVWTRSGPYAYFDEDRGSPSPGFRIGFATIQGPYFDAQVGRNVYVLITSSGHRTELRQVETTNTYEAGDSSHLQLITGGTLLLRSTDGMQVSYSPSVAQEWRATAIEDRNGNFFSVGYDWRGDIASVTDTLGRVITFNYDGNSNLSTITQTWQVNGAAQTHTWASFGWGTKALQPAFSSVAAVGTYAGEVVPVLNQVGLDDGSRYTFEYASVGQVNVIHRFSSDNVERSRMTCDYATLADDCPRVIATRVWADNWTGSNGVPSEVVTQFNDPGNGSHMMTAPDGTVYKESYGTGWQRGLVTQEEVETGGAEQRLSVTTWDQDNTGVSYQTNPRVKETNVYDFPTDAPSNRRRTTIDYGQYVQYGLPYVVTEYDSDGARELRRTYIDYNLSQAYLDRRIIGLVSSSQVYDPVAGKFLAKTTYAYDEAGSVQPQAATATGHDQSYNSSFLTRGNVTSVSRWDVNDIGNAAKAHTARVSYDAAGSVVGTTDPAGHQSGIGYADSFSDGNNSRGTFAYPTTLTDGDGFLSAIQYNFNFGAKTRFEGPPPDGQPNGLIQTFAYDSATRLQQVTTQNNGAYIRYLYGPNYVVTFSTINTATDEAYTNATFDGVGRTIGVSSNNPGSAGGYKAQLTQYDLMGRAVKRSNPTEIDGAWNPYGDDAAGWLYTQQSYDWKGRPRVTTNPGDGTQSSASYEGCGCAGGEVVTLTDETGRQQKVYSDPLGRQWKIEILNGDGSVYSTTESTLNALDQAAFVRQYQGTDQSGVYQETANGYDGYGRLQSKHAPAQDTGKNTTYTYYADDTVATVTDARGVQTTYHYNGRHLVEDVFYDGSQAEVQSVSVNYDYDAAGNRILMDEGGGGSTTYSYNSLSQLQTEVRHFAGLSGSFQISYEYNLAGQPKKITDPFGASVNYSYDLAGRTQAVTNTGFTNASNVSSYATGMQYRAWGGLKQFNFGANSTHSEVLTYDTRMRVHTFHVNYSGPFSSYTEGADIDYYDDGLVKYVHQLRDSRHDRAFFYNDPVGRPTQELTGDEAQGVPITTISQRDSIPFQQSRQYDAWNNVISTGGWHWTKNLPTAISSYVNDRNLAFLYDAEGNVTQENGRHYTYDAAGRTLSVTEPPRRTGLPSLTNAYAYDGDGDQVRSDENGSVKYELRSSLLRGQLLTDINAQGQKITGYVYANGWLLAKQNQAASQADSSVMWVHKSPDASGEWQTVSAGWGESLSRTLQLDAMGRDVGLDNPYDSGDSGLGSYPNYGDPADLTTGCALDGSVTSCGPLFKIVGRDYARFIYLIISGRMGQRMPLELVSQTYTDKSIPGLSIDNPNGVGYSQTVYAAPDPLSISTVGYNMVWLSIRPVMYIQPQNPAREPLTQKDIYTARRNIKDMLENPVCNNFIKGMLEEFGKLPQGVYSTDILEIFDAVRAQSNGGLFHDISQQGSLGYAFGSLERGNAIIAFGYSLNGGLGMHETMHVAARKGFGFSHQEMAQAAITSAQAMGISVTGSLPNPNDYPTAKAWDDATSQFFERIFFDACVKKR